jgi:hypothetical protein
VKNEPQFLDPLANKGYLSHAIPAPRDGQIADLLRTVESAAKFRKLESKLTSGRKQVLRVFAERMATQAVREKDLLKIYLGLIALALGGLSTEEREAILVLPLLYRATELLGRDSTELFEKAVDVVDSTSASFLRSFLMRADKSIEQMGYVETLEPDGFRFERRW